MKPTRLPVLAGIVVLGGAVGFSGGLVIDGLGTSLPRVPVSAPTVLLLATAMLLAIALTTRSRLRALRERRPGGLKDRPPAPRTSGYRPGGPGARPLSPLTVARYAMFAKATSPVAAGAIGLYAGYALFLAGGLGEPGRADRALMSLFAVGAALALVGAALFLERVCRLPEDGDPPNGNLPHPRAVGGHRPPTPPNR